MNKRDLLLRRDALHESFDMARKMTDSLGWVGYGIIELFDGDGQLKEITPFTNKITDVGDMYYAQKCIVGIAPASLAAPTIGAVIHMKLGTGGATPETKAGAGAAMVTVITNSSKAFDATYPQVENLGAGLGVNSVYKTTWAPTEATNAAINEAVISTDSGTGGGTAANTICRATFAAQNKAAADTLALTWKHKNLGP